MHTTRGDATEDLGIGKSVALEPKQNMVSPLRIEENQKLVLRNGNVCSKTELAGELAERLMAPVLKTGIPGRVSGVRIPHSPPFSFNC